MEDNNLPKADSVIIYSGGLDSTTLLYEERERIALAVTFNYGSNHAAHEMACAAWHCEKLGIEHLIIDLGFFGRYMPSSLTDGADAVPEGRYDNENMRSTVVPFRNGIMLSIATGLAESRNLKRVLMANHSGDHAIYPDCRPPFVRAMGAAMTAGTYAQVQLAAPFTPFSKADIVRSGIRMGVDYSHTYSCYKGGDKHCGRCGTCTERKEAFALAGVPDPTEYEENEGPHPQPLSKGRGE